MSETEGYQPEDFEARKKLISPLKEGDSFTIDGSSYTFTNVDNPYFPNWIYGKGVDGKFVSFRIGDIEEGKIQFSESMSGEQTAETKKAGAGTEEQSKSELSQDILKIIDATSYQQEDYTKAGGLYREVSGGGLPDNAVIERMAKILTATKRNESVQRAVGDMTEHAMWMLTEAHIQLGNSKKVGELFEKALG